MQQDADRIAPEATAAWHERPPLSGHPGLTASLWVVLGLLAAVTPFATEFYLPAFPAMTRDLNTSATGIQLTLAVYFVGIAVGQLVFGPLSDRLGRRWPLIGGTLVCVIAGAVSALAPDVEVLVAARFVQALAGAAGMVIGRAIISDVAVGREAARAFSLMMMVVATAPIVAPIAGSLLATSIGWRGILWVVCAMTAVMLVAVVLFVPESHPRERREHARAVNAGARPAAIALRSRVYVGNMLAFGFSFAALMAYMSASPFVFQVMAGLSPVAYGVLYGIIALVLVLSSAVSARLTARHAVGNLLGLGLVVLVVATLTLLALVLFEVPAIWFALPIVAADASLGLILGNASSLALSAVPQVVGTASAILGTVQFAFGAAVSPLVSIAGEGTAIPLAIVMATSALLASAGYLSARSAATTASPNPAGHVVDETAAA